jgi:hypothetical protein
LNLDHGHVVSAQIYWVYHAPDGPRMRLISLEDLKANMPGPNYAQLMSLLVAACTVVNNPQNPYNMEGSCRQHQRQPQTRPQKQR